MQATRPFGPAPSTRGWLLKESCVEAAQVVEMSEVRVSETHELSLEWGFVLGVRSLRVCWASTGVVRVGPTSWALNGMLFCRGFRVCGDVDA